jgi:4-amino-4-deoxy-L-arabinose transferase-like glycosyltransferase
MNHLSERSLWTDEFFTLFQSTGHGADIKVLMDSLAKGKELRVLSAGDFKVFVRPDPAKHLADVIRGVFSTDTHPPFYFGIIYLWMRLFSDTHPAVRSFSVLMGIASILLAYQLGGCLFSKREGFFCAIFVSVSAFCVRYAQEARSYSLVMALGLASSLLLLRLERHDKKSDGLLFLIVNALGIYTHYFYIFIACAQFAYFTFVHRENSKLLCKFYLFFLSSLLLLSPWVIPLLFKGYNFYFTEWVFGYPGTFEKFHNLFYGLGQYIFIFDKPSLSLRIMLLLGLAWFAYALWLALKDMLKKYPGAFCFCLFSFALPLLGMLFIDIIETGALLKQERFWVFPFLGFIPLAGYTLNKSFSKNRLVTSAFILCMLFSSWQVSSLNFGPAPKRASEWINQQGKAKESCVIIYAIRSAVFSQAYYLNDRIYLLPVASQEQLKQALKQASSFVRRVFICRHYHRTDSSLMDQSFMAAEGVDSSIFSFAEARLMDDISVFEYERR